MKLLDFMCIDAIQVDLQSSEKEDVITYMRFNNIIEKVNYITREHSKELEAVLLKDDALSTMLIDMINRKKNGNDFQRAKLLDSNKII